MNSQQQLNKLNGRIANEFFFFSVLTSSFANQMKIHKLKEKKIVNVREKNEKQIQRTNELNEVIVKTVVEQLI